MKTTWLILAVQATDGLITQAKYYVVAKSGDYEVATEGNWFFQEPKITVPFEKVTEDMIVKWIKSQTMVDGKNIIESRLAEQLSSLAAQQKTQLPWMPQVFTPEI